MDPAPDPRIPTSSAAICLGCSYPLSGLDPSGACPECGKPVALSRPNPDLTRYPVAASRPNPATHHIPPGVKCRMCTYALDGLDRSSNCPECNFPIERSLRGDLLLDSPASHLALLRLGARLIFWATLTPLITIAVFLLFLWSAGLSAVSETIAWTVVVALIASYLAFFLGWFLFSTRDRGSFIPGIESMRRATRLGILITGGCIAAIIMFYWLIYIAGTSFFGGDAIVGYVFGMVYLATLPAGLATMILSMIYLRRWSQRIPDAFLYKRARLMMWAWPGVVVLNIIILCGGQFLLISTMGGGMGGMPSMFLVFLPYVLFFGSLLLFTILYAHLFARIARALHTVRQSQLYQTPAPTSP